MSKKLTPVPRSSSQHGPAALLGPPYVYSYYKSNYSSLVEAVHQAFTTPIERLYVS